MHSHFHKAVYGSCQIVRSGAVNPDIWVAGLSKRRCQDVGVNCRCNRGSPPQTSLSCMRIDHAECLQHDSAGLVVAVENSCTA